MQQTDRLKLLMTGRSSIGQVKPSPAVQFVRPLPQKASLKLLSASTPRGISPYEVMVTPLSSQTSSFDSLPTDRPDLVRLLSFVSLLGGNPLAIELAASLLEDLSFSELQHNLQVVLRNDSKIEEHVDALSDSESILSNPILLHIRDLTQSMISPNRPVANSDNRYGFTDMHRRNKPRENTDLMQADTLRYLGLAKVQTGDVSGAIMHLSRAKELYAKHQDDLGEADSLYLQVDIMLQSGEMTSECQPMTRRILDLYSAHNDVIGIAWALMLQSELILTDVQQHYKSVPAATRSDAIKEARANLDQAISSFEKNQENNGLASALRVKARLNMLLNNMSAARNDLLKANQIFSTSNNLLGQAYTNRMLGNLFAQLLEYDQAQSHLQQALLQYRGLANTKGEAACLRSLGDVCLAQGDLVSAGKRLRQALHLFEKMGALRDKGLTLRTLGEVQLAMGEELGFSNLESAIDIFRSLGRLSQADMTNEIISTKLYDQIIPDPEAAPTNNSIRQNSLKSLQKSEYAEFSNDPLDENDEKQRSRQNKWRAMIKFGFEAFAGANPSTVKRRIRKGIPYSLRGAIWQKLAKNREIAAVITGTYREFLLSAEGVLDIHALQTSVSKKWSANPLNSSIHGSLVNMKFIHNILIATLSYKKDLPFSAELLSLVGYAALILKEEEAFWFVLVLLGGSINVQELLMPNYSKYLAEIWHIIFSLMKRVNPRLHKFLQQSPSVVDALQQPIHSWFKSLFAVVFSPDLLLRIWDIYLHESRKVIFRVCFAILERASSQIIRRPNPQLIPTHLQSAIESLEANSPDEFIRVILNVSFTTKQLDSLSNSVE